MTPLSTGNLIHRTHTLYRSLIAPVPSFFPAQHLHLPAAFKRMSSSQAKRLVGKTILITGASSGIGKSTALEFARTQPDDLKLILTARREDALKEVKKEIEGFAKGVKVHVVKLDVSSVEEIGQFVGKLPEEFKEIDVLVNNACVVSLPPRPPPSLPQHTHSLETPKLILD
jgi:3-hydroxy acid dehydrogenase/malonic semialdehyde reductase